MRFFWLVIGLILVAGLVYSNSFPGAFHFDDYPLLLENARVVGPTFFYASFLDHYAGRPLTMWTFHWNHRLAGNNPAGYHWVSVLLHMLVAVELFALVYQLFGEKVLAFVCSLLFVIHPLQTQAVNYIWSRSILLMAVFGLGSLLLARRFPVMSLISFQLAIWCRTEAVIFCLPLILLSRSFRRMPVVLAVANIAVFVYSLLKYAPQEMAWTHSDLLGYWIIQPVVFLKYMFLMIWPIALNVDHDLGSLPTWALVGAMVIVLGLLIQGLRFRRMYPIPALGLLWIAVTLSPSLLIPNADLINESRAYLSLAGFTLVVSWIFCRLQSTTYVVGKWTVAVLSILFLVPLTMARNEVWQDDRLLWQDSVRKSPTKARPHYNLGVALIRQGQYGESEVAFHRAREINPEDDLSYAALAYCAELRNELKVSLELYRQALHLNPENAYARKGFQRLRGRING